METAIFMRWLASITSFTFLAVRVNFLLFYGEVIGTWTPAIIMANFLHLRNFDHTSLTTHAMLL